MEKNISAYSSNGIKLLIDEDDERIGDEHISTSVDTPLRPDAFQMSDEQKMKEIEHYFGKIMHTLGLDLNDESLKGTPRRVAKMYIKEIFSGLSPQNKPQVSIFPNVYNYNQMLMEKNITFYSNCEHHFVPIIGKAHVAYISSGKIIGLSKINRVVDYFARRPQVQERLTVQIAKELMDVLETDDVAVMIEAKHLCVSSRGIKDDSSLTITSSFNGKFLNDNTRSEFINYIKSSS